jgi:hypothetical protein
MTALAVKPERLGRQIAVRRILQKQRLGQIVEALEHMGCVGLRHESQSPSDVDRDHEVGRGLPTSSASASTAPFGIAAITIVLAPTSIPLPGGRALVIATHEADVLCQELRW